MVYLITLFYAKYFLKMLLFFKKNIYLQRK